MKRSLRVFFSLLIVIFILSGCNFSKEKATLAEEKTEVVPLKEQANQKFKEQITAAETYRNTPEDDYEKTAMEYVNLIFSSDYQDAVDQYTYTDQMAEAISVDMFKTFKDQMDQKMGAFVEIFDITSADEMGYHVVRLKTKFELQNMTLAVSFDKDAKIAGFITEPFVDREVVKRTELVTEKLVKFGEPNWQLRGVLTVPSTGNVTAVVILVHGSGPNDRNETIGPNAPFKDLAYALAEQGIATLRYDKRTFTYGQKIQTDTDFTPKEEVIDDVVYASQYLRLESGLNPEKVYVLGHSMGGYLIPQMYPEVKDIDGYIFMNANARSLSELAFTQFEYLFNLDGTVTDSEKDNLSKLKVELDKISLDQIDQLSDEAMVLGAYKNYWKYLQAYAPLELVKNIKVPMYFAQGLRDYQVSETDLNLWKSSVTSNQNTTFKTYEGLNHLMMFGEKASSPDEYYTANQVDKSFISDIVSWINSLN